MKKILSSLCLLFVVLAVGLTFVGCGNKVASIAIKDGIIKTQYYVGEDFDATSGTLIATIGNKDVEIALTDSEVRIVNFSTERVVNNATAQINYKGKSTEFNYSVSLKPMLDFELSGGTYTYDREVHDVIIGKVVEGATITKTYANAGLYGTEFTGAVNAGTYVVNVTVSKEGYDAVTKSAQIVIEPIEVVATIEGGNFVYNGSVFEVQTRISGVLAGDDVKVAIGGTDKARNAGTYYAYCTGVGGTNAINYVLNTELSPSENNPYMWTIEKATVTGVDNDTVSFSNQTLTYNGEVRTIEAATKQFVLNEGLISEESPLTETYEYWDASNVSHGHNGVTNAGTYTVFLTYKFANYNDIVLTAQLEIEKANVDISGLTLQDLVVDYDGTAKSLSVNGTLPSEISAVVITYNGETIEPTEVGTYDVIASFVLVDEVNFNATNLNATLIIKALPVAWKIKDAYANEYFDSISITEIENGVYELSNDSTFEINYLVLEFNGTDNSAKLYRSNTFDESELIEFSVISVDGGGYITEFSINGTSYYVQE